MKFVLMPEPELTDFYQGWMIEITKTEAGYRCICYNSNRQRLSDPTLHPRDLYALAAAKRLIDDVIARCTLANFLREIYELNKLEFEEWQSLQRSLAKTLSAS